MEYYEKYHGKTVVITGASGYLANSLVNELVSTPAHIIRVSRSELAPVQGTTTYQGDISCLECWNEIVATADIIFHFAGNTSLYHAIKDPSSSLGSTLLPITHLISAAQTYRRKPRVILTSTATIYGLVDELPVSEDYVPVPITNYDLHKLFAERQLQLASARGVLDGISLRLSNVYGPSAGINSSSDRGILNKVIKMSMLGKPVNVYGSGKYIRDYIHIDDVVRACIIAAVRENQGSQTFNIGSGCGVTIQDAFELVTQKVASITGIKVPVQHCPWPAEADPIEFRNFIADITLISNTLNWKPKFTLEEGIENTVRHFIQDVKHS